MSFRVSFVLARTSESRKIKGVTNNGRRLLKEMKINGHVWPIAIYVEFIDIYDFYKSLKQWDDNISNYYVD